MYFCKWILVISYLFSFQSVSNGASRTESGNITNIGSRFGNPDRETFHSNDHKMKHFQNSGNGRSGLSNASSNIVYSNAASNFNSNMLQPSCSDNTNFSQTDRHTNFHNFQFGNPLPLHHIMPPPALDGNPYPPEFCMELLKAGGNMGYIPNSGTISAESLPMFDVPGIFGMPPIYGYRSVRYVNLYLLTYIPLLYQY